MSHLFVLIDKTERNNIDYFFGYEGMWIFFVIRLYLQDRNEIRQSNMVFTLSYFRLYDKDKVYNTSFFFMNETTEYSSLIISIINIYVCLSKIEIG